MGVQLGIDKRGEAARYALAARRGIMRPNALHGISRTMYDTLTLAELEEMVPPTRSYDETFNDMPV